jgi:hypothetical protein
VIEETYLALTAFSFLAGDCAITVRVQASFKDSMGILTLVPLGAKAVVSATSPRHYAHCAIRKASWVDALQQLF